MKKKKEKKDSLTRRRVEWVAANLRNRMTAEARYSGILNAFSIWGRYAKSQGENNTNRG